MSFRTKVRLIGTAAAGVLVLTGFAAPAASLLPDNHVIANGSHPGASGPNGPGGGGAPNGSGNGNPGHSGPGNS